MKFFGIRTLAILSIAVSFGASFVRADALAESAHDLVVRIEQQVPEGYRDPISFFENENWRKSAEFAQLEMLVVKNWSSLLDQRDVVAPTEVEETILFIAFDALPPADYLRFLDAATTQPEIKALRKRTLKWILFPNDKRVRGVLSDNYKTPIARKILYRVKTIFAGDTSITNLCNMILSGG